MNILNRLGFGPKTPDPNSESGARSAVRSRVLLGGGGGRIGISESSRRHQNGSWVQSGLAAYPSYEDVCTGATGHSEVVRVQYDPKDCSFEALLDLFWSRHDPTTLNRQVSETFTQCHGFE